MNRNQKLALVTAGLYTIVFSQAQMVSSRPAFEVVSIKPNNNNGPRVSIGAKSPGMFFGENVTLKGLIQEAYGVTIERSWLPFRIAPQQGIQILGGPSWITSDRFDVMAKWKTIPAEQSETIESAQKVQGELHLRLQTLLEQRFLLKLHREIKDLPIYELTVVKSTVKLKQGSCTAYNPTDPSLSRLGQAPSNYCGNSRIGRKGLDWTLDGTAMNMTDLAGTLSLLIGRRAVVDHTGFTGTFDVHLQWTPGLGETGDADMPVPVDGAGPSIFAVLQERLGLRLKTGKGPVEVLVIDRAEKPSAN